LSKIIGRLWISITYLSLAACNFHSDKTALSMEPISNPSRTSLTSFNAIKLNILDPKCLRCHDSSGEGGVDLTNYKSIMANPGLVVAGDLQNSRLYTEVFTGSMPEDGPVLNANEISAIANWIEAGAPDGDLPHSTPPAEPAPVPPASTVYSQIQKNILDQSCVRCHSGTKPSGKVDLSSFQKMMSNKKVVIIPGKPESSLVYIEIANATMPPKGSAINSQLVELLKIWILNGALEKN
jgi:cytochrome c553